MGSFVVFELSGGHAALQRDECGSVVSKHRGGGSFGVDEMVATARSLRDFKKDFSRMDVCLSLWIDG